MMGRKAARKMYSCSTNKIGIQCICWFYSQGICYDARSYDRYKEKFQKCTWINTGTKLTAELTPCSNSPSWDADSFLASQKKFRILWNPKFHDPIHNSLPPVPKLRKIRPVQTPHPMPWRSILTLFCHLRLDLPSGLFPLGFPIKTMYAFLFSPHTYSMPSHLIAIDLITRIMFDEYRTWSSS